jgi:4-hydroxy-tetrahydrodipicolinate reductase
MGQMIVRQISLTPGCKLVAASEAPSSERVGQDAGTLAGLDPLGVSISGDAEAVFRAADVVTDFTLPEATAAHAQIAAATGTALVAGTSGMSSEQMAVLSEAARKAPVFWAANMSVGVTLLLALVEQTARTLDAGYDIEIIEMHHRLKIDAPSGTALALGRAAAAGRGIALDKMAERGRDGVTGKRRRGAIGFAALRGGDVAGDHTVIFAGEGERLELTHKASSRQLFAQGAVRAALWMAGKPPGLYDMTDVLGLR